MKDKSLKELKVAIVGTGMVGGALADYFRQEDREPLCYDKGKKEGSIEEVNKADVIFICVPTPYDQKKDLIFP